jgi:hypothetical protein
VGYIVCSVITVLNVYLLWTTLSYCWVIGFAIVGTLFAIWVTYFYHEKDDDKNAFESVSAA